ncbi:MAG: hypothetical protein JO165_08315 [Candidatus Eremiobacteraeota bacterium]|nr:hypothetical protein [Candidatus Eremiobacteraeota bacterium]
MDGFEAYLVACPNVATRRALMQFLAARCEGAGRDTRYDGSLELLVDDVMAFLQSHREALAQFDAEAEAKNVLRSDLEAIADQIDDCEISLMQLPFSPAAVQWSCDLDELLAKHRMKSEELARLQTLDSFHTA